MVGKGLYSRLKLKSGFLANPTTAPFLLVWVGIWHWNSWLLLSLSLQKACFSTFYVWPWRDFNVKILLFNHDCASIAHLVDELCWNLNFCFLEITNVRHGGISKLFLSSFVTCKRTLGIIHKWRHTVGGGGEGASQCVTQFDRWGGGSL